MSNIVLLIACLVLGVLLRASGKLPDNAPASLNGYITNVTLGTSCQFHECTAESRRR
jgi:hypothetical protein